MNPHSRHDSVADETFGQIEDLQRENVKLDRENKRLARVVSGRSEGRRSPSETEKSRLVLARGKRDVTGDEASHEMEDLRHRCFKMERETERLALMVSELDSDNEHLQDLLDEQESQIRIMQEQRFNQFEANKGFFRAEDDETVRRKIQSCMKSLRSWATNYALPHRRNIQQSNEGLAGELFRSNVIVTQFAAPDGILSPQHDAVAPGIILNTLVAKFVTDWIVQQPFFGLNGASTARDDSSSELAQVSRAFHSVYQRAQAHGKICSAGLESD